MMNVDNAGDNNGECTDADKWCSDMGETPLWWSDDDDCDDFAHKWSDSPLASIATRKVTNDKNLAILLQSSIQEEITDIDEKISLVEDFDQELYAQAEVLDNLEQTLEGQIFPWNLSESEETCTLMVGYPILMIILRLIEI